MGRALHFRIHNTRDIQGTHWVYNSWIITFAKAVSQVSSKMFECRPETIRVDNFKLILQHFQVSSFCRALRMFARLKDEGSFKEIRHLVHRSAIYLTRSCSIHLLFPDIKWNLKSRKFSNVLEILSTTNKCFNDQTSEFVLQTLKKLDAPCVYIMALSHFLLSRAENLPALFHITILARRKDKHFP